MTKGTPKKPRQAKPASAGRAIVAPTGQEARDGTKATPAPVAQPENPLTAMLGRLHLLRYELADLAPVLGEHFLDAARVVEGVSLCLSCPVWNGPRPVPRADSEPEGNKKGQQSRLARAATDLAGKASKVPRTLRENRPAADALVAAVKLAQQDPSATVENIARHLEIARTLHAHLGARRVLPHGGTAEERIALFKEAIKRLWDRTDGGALDHEAVVSACARACGNKRELFGAVRKAVKRSGHE